RVATKLFAPHSHPDRTQPSSEAQLEPRLRVDDVVRPRLVLELDGVAWSRPAEHVLDGPSQGDLAVALIAIAQLVPVPVDRRDEVVAESAVRPADSCLGHQSSRGLRTEEPDSTVGVLGSPVALTTIACCD